MNIYVTIIMKKNKSANWRRGHRRGWGKIKGENDVILFHFLEMLGVVSSQHLGGRGRRISVNSKPA